MGKEEEKLSGEQKIVPENFLDEHGNERVDRFGEKFCSTKHLFDVKDGEIVPRLTSTRKLRRNQKTDNADVKAQKKAELDKANAEEVAKLEVYEEEAQKQIEEEEKQEKAKQQSKPIAKKLVSAMKTTAKAAFGKDCVDIDSEDEKTLEDSAKDAIEERGGFNISSTKMFFLFAFIFFVPRILQMAMDGELKGLVGKLLNRKSSAKTFDSDSHQVVDVEPMQ